jgi:hypothetical protein
LVFEKELKAAYQHVFSQFYEALTANSLNLNQFYLKINKLCEFGYIRKEVLRNELKGLDIVEIDACLVE